jgi:hypothetical protein
VKIEKHNLSLQAKVALETIKVKANEIDKQYGISEKAAAAKTAAVEKAKKLDEEFHITEKASTAANTVKTTVVATSQKVTLSHFHLCLNSFSNSFARDECLF